MTTSTTIRIELFDNIVHNAVLSARGELLEHLGDVKGQGYEIKPLGQHLWPGFPSNSSIDRNDIVLAIVPLDRIGMDRGKSGSKVFVSYLECFSSTEEQTPHRSKPLVLKIASGESISRLRHEKETFKSIETFLSDGAEYFAAPLLEAPRNRSDASPVYILWSPFTGSHKAVTSNGETIPIVTDLRDKLNPSTDSEDSDNIVVILNNLYGVLTPLHKRGSANYKIEQRPVVKEYCKYLRKLTLVNDDSVSINEAGDFYKMLLGLWPKEIVLCPNEKKAYTNPISILRKLLTRQAQAMAIGAIHGDLHPRNIVFQAHGGLRIIDFGWTDTNAHIVKDFVLLECNLRFFELSPYCSHRDIKWMTGAFLKEENVAVEPRKLSIYCRKNVDAIRKLRALYANGVGKIENSFCESYLVPLFLVGLGLGQYLDSCKNQLAWQMTLLRLGKAIENELNI